MKIGITTIKLWDDNTSLVFKRLYNLHNYINFSFIEGVNTNTRQALFTQVDKNIYTVFADKLLNIFSILKDLDNI